MSLISLNQCSHFPVYPSSDIFTARFLEGAKVGVQGPCGKAARLLGWSQSCVAGSQGGELPCPALSRNLVPQPGARGTAIPLLVSWWDSQSEPPSICCLEASLQGTEESLYGHGFITAHLSLNGAM